MTLCESIEVARKLGDVMAIPIFIVILFYLICFDESDENSSRSKLRHLIVLFVFLALLADTIFTLNYAHMQIKKLKC